MILIILLVSASMSFSVVSAAASNAYVGNGKIGGQPLLDPCGYRNFSSCVTAPARLPMVLEQPGNWDVWPDIKKSNFIMPAGQPTTCGWCAATFTCLAGSINGPTVNNIMQNDFAGDSYTQHTQCVSPLEQARRAGFGKDDPDSWYTGMESWVGSFTDRIPPDEWDIKCRQGSQRAWQVTNKS